MSTPIYCPKRRLGTVDLLVCIYTCPRADKIRCVEYTKRWPEVLAYVPDEKYVEKYGEPVREVPVSLRTRAPRKIIKAPFDSAQGTTLDSAQGTKTIVG